VSKKITFFSFKIFFIYGYKKTPIFAH